MATRRGKGGGRGMGGLKEAFISGFVLITLAGAVFAWANVNNIKSSGDLLDYFRAWSKKADECVNKQVGGAETVKDVELQSCGSIGVPDGDFDTSIVDPGEGGTIKESPVPVITPISKIKENIEKFTVSPAEEIDYNRAEWKHWSDLDKNGCDSREDTLITMAVTSNIVKTDPTTCKILSGKWIDPYSGKEITESSSIDIDHIVPLSYAARHGGQKWDARKKEQFANDPVNLIISSATENRKKGDKGPSSYMPPRKEFHCSYSVLWSEVIAKYGLTVAPKDASALKAGVASCG